MTLSNRIRHFFHVISTIRPIVWIGLYVALTPIFATIYWALPDGQFRIPDNAGTDWGSWFYYSIVTITTLGFGDYTPAHGWAQAVTAIEVMCGLIFLGFFLNAVGSMKSEIDIETEKEKQRRLHYEAELEKLGKNEALILRSLNQFLDYCRVISTPSDKRKESEDYNPDFLFSDLSGLFLPSGLNSDYTGLPVIIQFMKSVSHTSLALDSLQSRVDLTLWPKLLEDSFSFVANYQLFSNSDLFFNSDNILDLTRNKPEELNDLSEKIAAYEGKPVYEDGNSLQPIWELYFFIKQNARLASQIETVLTEIISENKDLT